MRNVQHLLEELAAPSAFPAWLDAMDDELSNFYTEDVPGLVNPADPFTEQSLSAVLYHAQEKYGKFEKFDKEADKQLVERYLRFLGQFFSVPFEGQWVAIPREEGSIRLAVGPAIRPRYTGPFWFPLDVFRIAIDWKGPDWLVKVWNSQFKQYQKAIDARRENH